MKYIDTDRLKSVIKRLADLYQDTFTDNMRDRLIDFIDACIPDIVLKKETTEDSIQQEQPKIGHWKPTEEQMEALEDAWFGCGNKETSLILSSLMLDLKKLIDS